MAEQVDARGLSCPHPVIMTHNKMKELKKGIFEVMVDTDTSRENISRLAKNEGWEVVEVKPHDSGYLILLKKE
ncbi:MAG: sulfurtransferase TusA family protein [Thermodesulfovibrionales bacterium]